MFFVLTVLGVRKADVDEIVSGKADYFIYFYDSKNDTPVQSGAEALLDGLAPLYERFAFVKVDIRDENASALLAQIDPPSVPFIGTLLQPEGPPEFEYNLTSEVVKGLLDLKSVDISQVKPYQVESEVDMLDNYEFLRRPDLLMFYYGDKCANCSRARLHATKVAAKYGLQLFLVHCDMNAVVSQFCSRRQVRSFPWVQFLSDGLFYDYDTSRREAPEYKTIVAALSKDPKQRSGMGNDVFTEKYYAEHPTKVNPDGSFAEWPPKPDLAQLKGKIASLEKAVAELERQLSRVA